ncbi:MAG: tetratricopeptide repeat protein [Acidobacteriota bacterium]|jgi:thioredoxin-like negative regulator of GroEL
MDDMRRYTTPWALVALLFFAVLAAAPAAAQVPEPPPHPGDEPQMLDIPESDNPAVAARNALMEGRGSLHDAQKFLSRAQEEADDAKREKLEQRAHKAYDEAAQSFLAAIQYDNELTDAYAGLGEAWLETGQTDKALQAWGAAQKQKPKDPEILFGLGRCLVDLGRPSDAAQVYVMLDKEDAGKAKELIDLLKAWGEPRAKEGNEAAKGLLAWIEGLEKG